MTFEDDLINTQCNPDSSNKEVIEYIKNIAEKYYIDKQTVKNVIWKLIDENPKHIVLINGLNLLKELGLE